MNTPHHNPTVSITIWPNRKGTAGLSKRLNELEGKVEAMQETIAGQNKLLADVSAFLMKLNNAFK